MRSQSSCVLVQARGRLSGLLDYLLSDHGNACFLNPLGQGGSVEGMAYFR